MGAQGWGHGFGGRGGGQPLWLPLPPQGQGATHTPPALHPWGVPAMHPRGVPTPWLSTARGARPRSERGGATSPPQPHPTAGSVPMAASVTPNQPVLRPGEHAVSPRATQPPAPGGPPPGPHSCPPGSPVPLPPNSPQTCPEGSCAPHGDSEHPPDVPCIPQRCHTPHKYIMCPTGQTCTPQM